MEVRVYATLRPIVGGRSVTLDAPPATVQDVIDELLRRFPDLEERLIAEGAMRPYVAVMVNGRDIRHTGGLETVLEPDAELDIFPPVAGG
jgi:molybdopterin synthase sulfur carrier subunit